MRHTTARETWDAIYCDTSRGQRTWPSEDVIRFCARRLQPGMRVLEAGCGNGANLWFLGETYTTVGADCSNIAVADAYELTSNRGSTVAIKHASLGTLRDNGVGGIFDALIDCRASQHTPWSQHAAIYREYYELLRPGGWLFLLHLDNATSDARQVERQTAGERWTWDDVEAGVYPHNGTVCMPPWQELDQTLRASGLVPWRCEFVGRVLAGQEDENICSHTAIDAQRAGT